MIKIMFSGIWSKTEIKPETLSKEAFHEKVSCSDRVMFVE